MRKYSKLIGESADLMQRHGIPAIRFTVNSRAHRTVYSDGRVVFDDEERLPSGSFQVWNMVKSTIIKNVSDSLCVSGNPYTDNMSVCIKGIKLSVEDEKICISEILIPTLTLANGKFTFEKSCVSCNIVGEARKNNFPTHRESVGCLIANRDLFKTHLSMGKKIDYFVDKFNQNCDKFGELVNPCIVQTAIETYPNAPFFDTEYLDYTSLMACYKGISIVKVIEAMARKNERIEHFSDVLREADIPEIFAEAFKNKTWENFSDGSYSFNVNKLKNILRFPIQVQNIMGFNAMQGILSCYDICAFCENFVPEDFSSGEACDALYHYFAHDGKKAKSVIGFLGDMVKELKGAGYPIARNTLTVKFCSMISVRCHYPIDDTAFDTFETIMEKDVMKAIDFFQSEVKRQQEASIASGKLAI